MSQTFRLTLKSTFEESERIPDFVEKLQQSCNLSDDITSSFMLLLSEAVSNAIDHGNEGDPEKEVHILIDISDSEIQASVKDEGEGFNPQVHKDPLQEENLLDARGRGLFLLNEMADSVTFSKNGTKLSFTLHRPKK